MKTYKVNKVIDYYFSYIPKRCRKPRYEKKYEEVKIAVRMITADEAPVAFRLSDYHHTSEKQTEIRCYKRKLYKHIYRCDFISLHGEERYEEIREEDYSYLLTSHIWFTYSHEERTREYMLKRIKDNAKNYLIIDGQMWERCGEPRYVVNTFGLGHNHGGTGLFVEEHYNPNIPNKNYFSALDGQKAVDYANMVAARRGDTNDVGRFEKMIEVFMPECVKIKPSKEHGDGDPFINQINAITEKCDSAAEAGLFAMCLAFAK